jgi:hypothetical protein
LFQKLCEVFASAAMINGDGVSGLNEDPEDCDIFHLIMEPVRACLTERNMRFVDWDAAMGLYKVLRVFIVDGDRLCPEAIIAGLSESLQESDTANYTTLNDTMVRLKNRDSPALTTAADLMVKELHTEMFNVATEGMDALVRPIVINSTTAFGDPPQNIEEDVALQMAPRVERVKKVKKAKRDSASQEQDVRPSAKLARQNTTSLKESPASRHRGSLDDESPASQHRGSLDDESPVSQHPGSLNGSPAYICTT